MENKNSAKKEDNNADNMREGGTKTGEPEEKSKPTERKADGRNGVKVAASLIIIMAVIISLYFFLMQQPVKNPYQLSFANETLNFRANLDKAAKVSVIPDEQSIRNAILSGNVSRIKISYVPGEQNPFYAAASFEVAYKLVIILKHYYGVNGYLYEGEQKENCFFFEETGKNICIISEPVPSEEDIKYGDAERVIFLTDANETSVTLKDNIVFIKGKDFSEKDRKYTDLDLAADRFLLVLMGK